MGIPHLNAVYERYRDRGLVVVGISVDRSPAQVVEFVKEIPIRYPNGMSNPQTVELFGDTPAIPTTFVVDREGRVRRMWQGMVDATMLEREILGLL
jgi:peroxiredoxin